MGFGAINYKSKAHSMIQTKSSYRKANISSKYKVTVQNTGSVIVAFVSVFVWLTLLFLGY